MRRPRYFDTNDALPRMSWSVRNLYNLWSRSVGPHSRNDIPLNHTTFTRSSASLFKQRWQAKKLIRAYHGDYIPEKKFVKWYLPERLPALHNPAKSSKVEEFIRGRDAWLANGRKHGVTAQDPGDPADGQAPISSLMFAELERRIDVVVFRSCFAHSIHAARQLVVHGKVTLNGIKESDPNTRLNPGDMVSVNPDAMTLLRPPQTEPEAQAAEAENASSASEEMLSTSTTPSADEGTISPSITSPTPAATDPPFQLPPYAAPFIFIPAYLEVSFSTCSTIYVRHPTARPGYSEIPSPYDADGEIVRFAWEWYGKHRSRIRGWKRELRDRMEKGKSGWDGLEGTQGTH